MSNQVQKVEQSIVPAPITPAQMLQIAVERGASLEQLEKFMSLVERHERNEAEKAYHDAVAEFKKNPPKILHDKTNKQYGSTYSSLANLVNTVNASLGEFGLNASWDFKQTDSRIEATCILTHRLGYSKSVTLAGPPDTSGSKNPLQQIKSTTTYLRGATFEAVVGIASAAVSADDDGNGAAGKEVISEEQHINLKALIEEVGADTPKFLKYMKVASLAEILARDFNRAVKALEAKRSK